MLSQSRDERRRLQEREGVILQQQQQQQYYAQAPGQHVFGAGASNPNHPGGMRHADTVAAAPPSVFDSIYEELDAGLDGHAGGAGGGAGGGATAGRPPGAAAAGVFGGSNNYRSSPAAPVAAAAAGPSANSNDPRKSYLRGSGGGIGSGSGSGLQPSARQQQQQQQQQHIHPSEAQAALATVARARMQQMQSNGGAPQMHMRPAPQPQPQQQQMQQQQQMHPTNYHSVGTARSSLTQLHTRDSQPRTSVQPESYEPPLALSHTVMHRQDRDQSRAAARTSSRGIQGMGSVRGRRGGGGGGGGPDIDSLVIYGNDRDDMSENSGLSQQRLLKKRHGHKLGSSTSTSLSSGKNYPKRNPNKKSNVTILGMPDSFGGGGSGGGGGQRNNHQSSANAVPRTTENAYERRLARERMRGLVRIGSSRMSNRGGRVGGGMGGYDGVESVDGESTSYVAPSPTRQQQPPLQQQEPPAQRGLPGGQRSPQRVYQQQQTTRVEQAQAPWWEGADTVDQAGNQGQSQQQQQQQQQQRRIPRSDGSTDGHDGRGGYDFGSLPLPQTTASTDDSYEDMNDTAGNNAAGAFPVPQTAPTSGYDNRRPPAASTSASSNSVPSIVPKRRSDRPYLAHSSSAGKMMEPIVEEDGPIRVGGMDHQQEAATPPRESDGWEQDQYHFHQQQQSSPLNRSGENLFNQYSINPVPDVPHRRNVLVGEGGGPSPRLGVPPAPTSYYDRPDPNDPALGPPSSSADQPSYNDDPNIVVGQWESPEDKTWNSVKEDFPQDKYEAAEAAAAAAIAGESIISPTSIAGDPQSSAFGAANRQLNYDEANQDASSGVRAGTPNSVLTDEMSNPVPRGMIRQRFAPDEIAQRPPRSSPQVSLSSGQVTAIDSAAAVAPPPDPMSQSQEEKDRAKRIEKAHAIRQRRVKEAREHGEDLLRTSPQRSAASSNDDGSGPLSPIDEIGMPRGELTFQEDAEWEPNEKPPSKRDIQKGRASEDLKGRVIDLSAPSSSKREKSEPPRVTFQDAEFGFIEAVAAVVIQTFIRRYLAYKAATIRYEAALTVKHFIIASTQAKREAREQEEELEFAQRQAEVEAQKREKILAKAHEQARMLSEADAAAIAEAENECLQQQGDRERQLEEEKERALLRNLRKANLSEDELAAITIQAAFRGWWVRDCLSVDNYCATLIQQTVRGYLRRMQYEFDFYRIVIVQSAARRFLAKRKASLTREGAEYVEGRSLLATKEQEQQAPKDAPRPANQKSWSVPTHFGTTRSAATASSVPSRPEAKTQSFAKSTPVVIETGSGKGSLINAWKAREVQAQQQAIKPNIAYQKKSKVVESSTIEKCKTAMSAAAGETTATETVQATKVRHSFMSQKTVKRVEPATQHQQHAKGDYSPEQNTAATKIQAQWRCCAAEMDYVHKLDSILLVQSLARRWVTRKLVLPYMIMARNGDFEEFDKGEYYDDYGDGEEGQYYDYYEEEQVAEVAGNDQIAEAVPAAPSPTSAAENKPPRNASAMSMWKEKEAKATLKPAARTSLAKVNTGATGGGSNSILQKWKQKEQEAIEKAYRPGR